MKFKKTFLQNGKQGCEKRKIFGAMGEEKWEFHNLYKNKIIQGRRISGSPALDRWSRGVLKAQRDA